MKNQIDQARLLAVLVVTGIGLYLCRLMLKPFIGVLEWAIVWGALVVSTIDNFLRPTLIRNHTKQHELFVFFSVLGGISVFGLPGIVLGPVVLAITLGLLQTFRPPITDPVVAD